MSQRPDFSDVELRRSKRSSRRMSMGRRLAYALAKPLLRFIVFVLTRTYRFDPVLGEEIAERIVADRDRAYVPVHWHAHLVACSYLIRDWIRRGFKAGYIISASVDGEVPADIVRSWGAVVVRGSAQNTGALVLRDADELMKQGVSVVTMSDGPLGPRFRIKTGTVLVARVGNAPLIPIVCAASRAWTLNTWDRFMIPKPFARIVLAVGEPIEVPRRLPMADLEKVRDEMQAAMDSLLSRAERQLSRGGDA